MIIDQFIKEKYLLRSWDKFQVDFTHAAENNGKTFTSILDHFCWNAGMDNSVVNAGVSTEYVPSFSCFFIIKADGLLARKQFPLVTHAKLSWKNASQEQRDKYRMSLENNLKSLEIPDCCEKCFNVHCQNVNHNEACDKYLIGLLKSVENAAKECIPYSGGNPHYIKKKPLPAMWNDEVQPFKDKALFWHAVWQSSGKPINMQLHSIMNRAIYHFQIRKCKKMTNTLKKKNTLLQACIENRNVDLFHGIKKMRNSVPTIANTIDRKCENIPNHFVGIYKDLYNSANEINDLLDVQHG